MPCRLPAAPPDFTLRADEHGQVAQLHVDLADRSETGNLQPSELFHVMSSASMLAGFVFQREQGGLALPGARAPLRGGRGLCRHGVGVRSAAVDRSRTRCKWFLLEIRRTPWEVPATSAHSDRARCWSQEGRKMSEKQRVIRTDIAICPNYVALCGQMANARGPALDLRNSILDRIKGKAGQVWTPVDFLDLGPRAAVDKALQRLVRTRMLTRVDRGLYHLPRVNALTSKPTVPDHSAVIDAVARRDQSRIVIDGLTAANDLGLTTAVPARVTVLADARLRPIRLGNQQIRFRAAAPSRLYWAGHPAMRIVQALYWLHDVLDADRPKILQRLRYILSDPVHGDALRDDLRKGVHTLPIWMQSVVRELLDTRTPALPRTRSRTKTTRQAARARAKPRSHV